MIFIITVNILWAVAFFFMTYVIGEEANCHANDEDGPEDVKTLQRHQEAVEKVVAKERFIDGHWVNPRAVNDPSAERAQKNIGTLQFIHCPDNKSYKTTRSERVILYRKGKMMRRVTINTAAKPMKM